jgi:hypothetical protein
MTDHSGSEGAEELDNTAWCAVYAIQKVADEFINDVKVEMQSAEDLAQLLKEWQKDIEFTPRQLQIWPGMSRNLVTTVLNLVYRLDCTEICQEFILNYTTVKQIRTLASICPGKAKETLSKLSGKHDLQQLASLPEFYQTTGVGIVLCQNHESGHVFVFETNKTESEVWFGDPTGNSREPEWLPFYAEQLYVVYAVYLVTDSVTPK